ncbi:DUF3489 domain-containing protein [Burkholderia diffusa]|uniref:DUF3489 domain-containing protein n=1 Tax=Burkholderia diffusa TaxID=488732 RepID=UPI000754A7DC|nr:DUF3489 domain-containing protein [Burkholderia diffusa]KVG31442.1 hypothetical protein WJ30_14860 [Burkholderia diffusa]
MSTIQLTPAQHAILAYAINHTSGKIDWFPDNIKGGARKKVIDGLSNRALITTDGADWFVAAEGYDALGVPRPGPVAPVDPADPEMEAAVETAEANLGIKAPRRTRENSKQALVIAMLRRPEGATIAQICEATSWQSHTVRGTLAGALKKKLGLDITSDKQNGERVYRIAIPTCK